MMRQTPKLEIVIFSSGLGDYLPRLMASIEMQSLKKSDYHYRVISTKNGVNREAALKTAQSEWVLFLDEDCYLPDKYYLNRLWKIIERDRSESHFFGGLYLSEQNAIYSVRAYNELCNSWILNSVQKRQTMNLMGGCLLLNAQKLKSVTGDNPIDWGGEDTYLIRSWQRHGFRGQFEPDLNLIHAPESNSLEKLRSRAVLHGRRRYAYKLGTGRVTPVGITHGIKNVKYWPVWALHFSFLAAGLVAQRSALIHRQ